MKSSGWSASAGRIRTLPVMLRVPRVCLLWRQTRVSQQPPKRLGAVPVTPLPPLSSDAVNLHPYSLTDESYPTKSCASGKTGSSASPVLRLVAEACAILLGMRTFVSHAAVGKRLLAALVPDVRVLDVQIEPEGFLLTVTPKARTAACPRCSTHSSRIHSSYIRRPADLPISGRVTRLLLHARRFRCVNATCPTVTFAERLPNLVLPAAQRMVRLNAVLRDRALAFGGQAGARQCTRSAMPARGDTLLRRAHAASPPVVATPRVLGIGDCSFRKGQVFGTILTDGERHTGCRPAP